ncbi:hypothetical protein [Amycolatopsis sp. WQ 127309]|uniref:hypothetical protein n=1 Tax=Amycolatopsis sp. WQ 127309 TaxID=2932773 RepID=UPI001FF32DCE|nr:hypothetical protein [Amycolatopsis sp. WQ 127309]UOZ07019.1 hypothetical protein MUY22_01620 [Amycolatopsis sp. WQ 127309]
MAAPHRRHRHDTHLGGPLDTTDLMAQAAVETDLDKAARLRAQAELAGMLDRLGDVVETALDLVTAEEFSRLVWRLPNPDRTNFLRELRVPPAKRPTPMAARDGLARLRTWPRERRTHAVQRLVSPVRRALAPALTEWRHSHDDDGLRQALTNDPAQANIVRLTVFADWQREAASVAALRIALRSKLALPTWPSELVDTVVEACQRLEALSGDSATAVCSDVEPGLDDFAKTAERLREALAEAQRAAAGVSARLADSRPAAPEDLAVIAALEQLADSAWVLLEEQGSGQGSEDCLVLAARLDAAAERASRPAGHPELDRLEDLEGPPEYGEMIASVRHSARELLGSGAWDDAQQSQAESLTALVRLVDATAAGEAGAAVELHQTAQATLPDDIRPLLVIALLGRLGFRAEDRPEPRDLIVAEPAPEPQPLPRTVAPPAEEETVAAEVPPPADEPDDNAEARQLTVALLDAGKLALAHHAAAISEDDRLAEAIRLLTLATAVRTEEGATAKELRESLEKLELRRFDGHQPAQLALLMSAVRAALVTADPHAGELVGGLSGHFSQQPHLVSLTSAIGTASARGQLYNQAILAELAPIAIADNDISAAAEAAAADRDRSRNLRFPRANQIAEEWWAPTGLIGRAVAIAAADRREDIETAAGTLRKLGKRQDLIGELKSLDDRLRSPGSRPLEGASRRRILEQATESFDLVRAWIDAVRAEASTARGPQPPSAQVAELRSQVREDRTAAAGELDALRHGSADPLLAAAATACLVLLEQSVDMLDGESLQGAEPDPHAVLNRDLLRSVALRLSADLVPDRPTTLEDIRLADRTSWETAFDERLANEDFVAVRTIVDAISEEAGRDMTPLLDQLEQAVARSRAEVRVLATEIEGRVQKAARLGQLLESARSDVLAQLEAARPDRDDLDQVRRLLAEIDRRLPEYAAKAKEELWERVTFELNRAGQRVPENAAADIRARIDAGDLATAEEYLLIALGGEEPPSTSGSTDLHRFLAALDTLPVTVARDAVKAAENGSVLADCLDFGPLSPAERTAAADGLHAWLDLAGDQRHRAFRPALAQALRLAGLEFIAERPAGLSDGPSRRWVELSGVKRVGDALIPAFGSLAGDQLRLMLCWNAPDVRTLFAWVAQDTSDSPVLVAVFGTLSAGQRRALSKVTAGRPEKPVIMLDDMALVYLAAYGGGRFAATERILLPFATTNPYYPHATGNVPSEMFKGRYEERSAILDRHGASLLYGGRQLGKSAVLQAAARRFEVTLENVAVYLSLPAFGVTRKPDALWDMIVAGLAERGITAPKQRGRDAAKHAERVVKTWLAADAQRRLVLLLDESDLFFDADATTGFATTTRLRDLMNSTDRRFKPVFAGLHQVQRFAQLPNQPLAAAHFGDALAIGPLAPEPAYQLMFTPMETLGISFASDELIHRVLAYCNYQPKLLQLVGEALVRSAHERREDNPRYVIGDDELERVIGSEAVRQKVREAVHLTLNLDSRYKLIALVVALSALERGADQTVTTGKLRDECLAWWSEGFTGQGADEFRSLLEEMSGLGVLAAADGGWRLRSSNVLRLLGSAQDIEDELFGSEWLPPTRLAAENARRTVADGLAAPLTEKQFATLIERSNRIRLVLGSRATGIDHVRQLLQEEHGRIGARCTLVKSTSPESYRRELRGGKPGDPHRIVFCDLGTMKVVSAWTAIDQALELFPEAGVTRTVVALASADASEVFSAICDSERPDLADLVVPLRRVSADGLRSWFGADNLTTSFSDAVSQGELLKITGGWTSLLNQAARLAAGEARSARLVCERIRQQLAGPEGAAELVDQVGVTAMPAWADAFDEFVNYDDSLTADDLLALFDEHGGAATMGVLRNLDVLVERPQDGLWELEPVIAAAWRVLSASRRDGAG